MTREANEAARSAAAKAAKDETRRREADETRRRIDALDASSTPPPDWFKARRRTP